VAEIRLVMFAGRVVGEALFRQVAPWGDAIRLRHTRHRLYETCSSREMLSAGTQCLRLGRDPSKTRNALAENLVA